MHYIVSLWSWWWDGPYTVSYEVEITYVRGRK